MKIPRVEMGRVQSLGRNNLAVVGAKARQEGATGQQQQQMLSLMSGVAGDYIQRQQDVEYDNTVAETQIQINNFEKNHLAKQFYTADELGNLSTEMVPRTTSSFVNGERVETPRDAIPAYEVYPHLLKQELEGMTAVNAEKISNPVLRKEYLRKAGITNSNMMMTAGIKAEQQQQQFVYEDGLMKASTAYSNGNWAEGEFYVENLVAPEYVKDKIRKQGATAAEVYEVGQAAKSTNEEYVLTMRSRYNDPNYDGDLTAGQAKQAVADFNAQLTVLGLEGIQDKATQQDIRDNNRLYSASLGNLSGPEVEAGYELWQVDPDHPDAINVDQRLRLHSAIDSYDSAVLVEERRVQKELDAAQTKAEKEAYSSYYSNLNRALDEREINSHAQIESIYDMGKENALEGGSGPSLKPADRTTMHRRLDTLNKEGATIANYEQIIAGALSGEYPLRATNPDHVKAVEHLVETVGLTRDSVEDLGKLTKLTGIMPDPLRDEIEGGLLSGNPEQGVAALSYIQNLQSTGSHLTSVLSRDTMDIANYANLLIRGGQDATQALKQANKMSEDLTPEMKTYFKTAYKDAKIDNVKGLSDQMDADPTFDFEWGYNRDIDIPAGMQAEYNAAMSLTYAFAKGDAALSSNLVYKNVKANWGVTNVGLGPLGGTGARASKYAPEKILQRSPKSVNLGLEAWAKSEGIDSEGIVLTHDKGTLKDHGWTAWVYDFETGATTIHESRWLADDWINEAVTADDKQALINAKNRMDKLGDDFVQSEGRLNADRVAGRDLQ